MEDAPAVKEIEQSATAKAQQLLADDAAARSNEMVAQLKRLCELYRCDLVAKIVIENNQLSSQVVVTPRT